MTLFIDTHYEDLIIITYNSDGIIGKEVIKNERENSKIIMPTIEVILHNQKPSDIVVVNGPGSFTGVRLGVTIAKTLAYTWNIPIRTITSLQCMAVCALEGDKIVAFSDRNGYFIGIFDNNYKLIGNYEYLTNKEFEEYSEKYNVVTKVDMDYERIIKAALKKDPINPHQVNPVYAKKIDVEK